MGMGNLSRKAVSTAPRKFVGKFHEIIRDKDVTDKMLQESYIVMAEIVKCYGEHYLPIFERLHEEIDNRRKTRKLSIICIGLLPSLLT